MDLLNGDNERSVYISNDIPQKRTSVHRTASTSCCTSILWFTPHFSQVLYRFFWRTNLNCCSLYRCHQCMISTLSKSAIGRSSFTRQSVVLQSFEISCV